jgi:hypothetical protein
VNTSGGGKVCQHGALARSCEVCERDKRIKDLETCIKGILAREDRDGKRVRFDHARAVLK